MCRANAVCTYTCDSCVKMIYGYNSSLQPIKTSNPNCMFTRCKVQYAKYYGQLLNLVV